MLTLVPAIGTAVYFLFMWLWRHRQAVRKWSGGGYCVVDAVSKSDRESTRLRSQMPIVCALRKRHLRSKGEQAATARWESRPPNRLTCPRNLNCFAVRRSKAWSCCPCNLRQKGWAWDSLEMFRMKAQLISMLLPPTLSPPLQESIHLHQVCDHQPLLVDHLLASSVSKSLCFALLCRFISV